MTKVGPEMSNACRELASHLSNPGPEHWKALERAVGYIKSREGVGLKFSRPRSDQLISFVDSNYATDPDDRKSISGRINTLGGTILNWSSKKQQTVTLSSTEAEYVALSECAQETKFDRMLLKEILNLNKPAKIFEDNTGTTFLVKNQQVGARTKHIDVRHQFIRGPLQDKTLEISFIRSENNYADIMTKNVLE